MPRVCEKQLERPSKKDDYAMGEKINTDHASTSHAGTPRPRRVGPFVAALLLSACGPVVTTRDADRSDEAREDTVSDVTVDARELTDAPPAIDGSVDASEDAARDSARPDAATPVDAPAPDTRSSDEGLSDVAAPIDSAADAPRDAPVIADASPDSRPTSCERIVVNPSPDATAALRAALASASMTRIGHVAGNDAARTEQGRVYLPAGRYGLDRITVPSNVRLEIEPGAVLFPLARITAEAPGSARQPAVFQIGRQDQRVSNVTITAGDGCGGPGSTRSEAGRSITNTSFRHNHPTDAFTWPDGTRTVGMTNAPIPWSSDWSEVSNMFVLDLDPRATGTSEDITGFWFQWTSDVVIDHVFTIQNAERYPGDDPMTGRRNQLVPAACSRTTAMMFEAARESLVTGAAAHLPQRVRVAWHYNVLSPPGQGANQIRSCVDCEFDHIFSHGGVALRVETDGVAVASGAGVQACDMRGPVTQYSVVSGLSAWHIEGAYGNRSLMFNPHCQTNGSAIVREVRGTGQNTGFIIETPEETGAGSFRDITVTDLVFDGDSARTGPRVAQNRLTMGTGGVAGGWRGYELAPSTLAAFVDATYPVTVNGTLCWPTSLADGSFGTAGVPTMVTHTGCPRGF